MADALPLQPSVENAINALSEVELKVLENT
jgi:hypothetical protein